MYKLLQSFGVHFNRHLFDDCDGDEGNGPIYGSQAKLWVGAERGVIQCSSQRRTGFDVRPAAWDLWCI